MLNNNTRLKSHIKYLIFFKFLPVIEFCSSVTELLFTVLFQSMNILHRAVARLGLQQNMYRTY